MKESKLIECECHSEILKVEQLDQEVYISLFVHGDSSNWHPRFFRRLRDAYRILFKHQYPDYAEVIISKDRAKSLGGYLLNLD